MYKTQLGYTYITQKVADNPFWLLHGVVYQDCLAMYLACVVTFFCYLHVHELLAFCEVNHIAHFVEDTDLLITTAARPLSQPMLCVIFKKFLPYVCLCMMCS